MALVSPLIRHLAYKVVDHLLVRVDWIPHLENLKILLLKDKEEIVEALLL